MLPQTFVRRSSLWLRLCPFWMTDQDAVILNTLLAGASWASCLPILRSQRDAGSLAVDLSAWTVRKLCLVWPLPTTACLAASLTRPRSRPPRRPPSWMTLSFTSPSLSGHFVPLIPPMLRVRGFSRPAATEDGAAGPLTSSPTPSRGPVRTINSNSLPTPGGGVVGARTITQITRAPARARPKGSAARLPFFVDNWAKVCSNKFILRIVAEGYKLQFISTPFQSAFFPRHVFSFYLFY